MAVTRDKRVMAKSKSTHTKSSTSNRVTIALAKRIRNVKTRDWIYVSPKENTWPVRMDGSHRVMRIYKQRIYIAQLLYCFIVPNNSAIKQFSNIAPFPHPIL